MNDRHWADRLPIFAALDEQARLDGWPACVVILADALDQEIHGRELPCQWPYWQAVRGQAAACGSRSGVPVTDAPDHSIVAGQSYGRLAAGYAVRHHHDRFRAAVSQPGSFWWPEFDRIRGEGGDPEPITGPVDQGRQLGVGVAPR